MKLKKIYFGIAAAALVGMTACTDSIAVGNAALDKATSSTATIDTVFNNAEYTRQFLTGIYSMQYYGLPYVNAGANLPHSTNPYAGKVDALTDCWHMGWNGAAVYGQYYTGAMTANVTRDDGLDGPLFNFTGEFQWKAIRSAWILIENIEKTPGMSDNEKAKLIAEARCLLVARFFDTFKHYGGIPIIDHALEANETTQEFKRNTVEECVKFMVDQLDLAINETNFPWAVADPANENGHWTRAAAMALKAKVLQFAASPLLNPKDGQPYYSGASEDVKPYIMYESSAEYQARWDAYYNACKAFFDQLAANGYYDLSRPTASKPTVQDYRIAYRKGYFMQDSKEILLSVRHQGYDSYSAGRYCWHSWYTMNVPRNLYWPTQEYVEKFGWFSSGRPFNYQTAFDYVYDNTKATPDNPGEGSENMKLTTSGTPNVSAQGLNSMFIRGSESKLTQYLINVEYTRDPRLYEECIVNGMQKSVDWTTASTSGAIWELWAGGTDGLTGIMTQTGMFGTGYGFNKYYLGNGSSSSGDNIRFPTQWVYLSLNEMYLNYAEALCMKSNPDYKMAAEMIDVVRSRVGVKSISNEFSTYSPKFKSRTVAAAGTTPYVNPDSEGKLNAAYNVNVSELVEAILDERARELGLQDIRWFDMIRYKRTDWMTKQLHGLEMHRLKQNAQGKWVVSDTQWENSDKLNDKTSTQPRFFTYKIVDIFANNRILWGRDPNSDGVRKWLLSPFPQTEINKKYGLIQNPGWE